MVQITKPAVLPTVASNALIASSLGFAQRNIVRPEFSILTNFDSIADNICNILFFRKGDYPDLPDFGLGIQDYLFENGVEETFQVAFSQEMRRQIAQYEPRATVSSLNIYVPQANDSAVAIDALIDIMGVSFDLTAAGNGIFTLIPQASSS
jgi:phage baseplate assembly protein W